MKQLERNIPVKNGLSAVRGDIQWRAADLHLTMWMYWHFLHVHSPGEYETLHWGDGAVKCVILYRKHKITYVKFTGHYNLLICDYNFIFVRLSVLLNKYMTLFHNSERDTHILHKHSKEMVFRWHLNSMRIQYCSDCREWRQRAVVSCQTPLYSETKPEQSGEKLIDSLTFFHMTFQINWLQNVSKSRGQENVCWKIR